MLGAYVDVSLALATALLATHGADLDGTAVTSTAVVTVSHGSGNCDGGGPAPPPANVAIAGLVFRRLYRFCIEAVLLPLHIGDLTSGAGAGREGGRPAPSAEQRAALERALGAWRTFEEARGDSVDSAEGPAWFAHDLAERGGVDAADGVRASYWLAAQAALAAPLLLLRAEQARARGALDSAAERAAAAASAAATATDQANAAAAAARLRKQNGPTAGAKGASPAPPPPPPPPPRAAPSLPSLLALAAAGEVSKTAAAPAPAPPPPRVALSRAALRLAIAAGAAGAVGGDLAALPAPLPLPIPDDV